MAIQAIIPRSLLRSSRPVRRVGSSVLAGSLLARDLEALLAGFWGDAAAVRPRRERSFEPRVDVQESQDEFRVTAELPGFGADDFQAFVEGEVLTLRGKRGGAEVGDSDADARSERAFSRSLRLPFHIDADAVTGEYRNGLLTLTVPKPGAGEAEPRTIPVTTD